MNEFLNLAAFDVGRKIEFRGAGSYAWLAVLAPAMNDPSVLEAFTLELHVTLESPVRTIAIKPVPSGEDLRRPKDDVVVLIGFERFRSADWVALDIHRSRLERPGPIIFWLSSAALTALCRNAPNLRSFLGGSIYALSPSGTDYTPAERKARIRELETFYGMSSDDLVTRREAGEQTPPDPEFAEWLVLLGRGDLV